MSLWPFSDGDLERYVDKDWVGCKEGCAHLAIKPSSQGWGFYSYVFADLPLRLTGPTFCITSSKNLWVSFFRLGLMQGLGRVASPTGKRSNWVKEWRRVEWVRSKIQKTQINFCLKSTIYWCCYSFAGQICIQWSLCAKYGWLPNQCCILQSVNFPPVPATNFRNKSPSCMLHRPCVWEER